MKDKSLTSIQKTCRILSALSDPSVCRLTDISRVARLDVSTSLRILKDLELEGFVERDPETKHYVLGPQVYVMHHAMIKGIQIKELARPALIRLAKQYKDTVILSVPLGWESSCLDLCFGNHPLRAHYLEIGSKRPLGIGAGSLALLAALPEKEQRAVLDIISMELKNYSSFNYEFLVDKIKETQDQGYAILLNVVVERMGGIAVVIKGPDNYPLAALSIAALTERIRDRVLELRDALAQEAYSIEQSWLPK